MADVVINQRGADTTVRVGLRRPLPLPLRTHLADRQARDFLMEVEGSRPEEVEPAPAKSRVFIQKARGAAWDFFADATTGYAADLNRIVTDIRALLLRRAPGTDPPLIEVRIADDDYVPWEWLTVPSRKPTATAGPVSDDELAWHLADVPAFGAVVCRVQRGGRGKVLRYLESEDNQIRLKYVRHTDLDGAGLQQGYFDARGAHIAMVGPLPDAEAEADLAAILVDPAAGVSCRATSRSQDQILHVHCHHDAVVGRSAEYATVPWATSTLVLRDKPPLALSYDQIRRAVADPDRVRKVNVIDGPLVFLNLCRGMLHPLSSQSMCDLLRKNHNRAVIGTSARVPDDVAAEFAALFYDSLLDSSGCPAGRALYEAKHHMLERFRNPVGLFYTYTGNPDLVIAPTLRPAPAPAVPF